MKQNIVVNDEIDLKKIFLSLWRGKFYIILSSIAFVFFGSQYLRSLERKYTVEYRLKPVYESKKNSVSSGFNGIASVVGIQLPKNTNTDFNIFRELITSVEVSEIVFENKKIIKNIFSSEWNESINDYSRPKKDKVQILISDIKKLLTGSDERDYIRPNPRRLANFISNNIHITNDQVTGFLSIKSVASNPELLLSLIINATEASDKIMRQRYVDFSTEPLTFYKEKIRTARSREHREALAELIASEEQKLMFASRGRYFIAEPYINPSISLHPTSPNPKLILTISLVLGLFIGGAIIMLQRANKKENL
jgi:uncharacterized protein involved in exopolysaccharide biosynthesis